jgi:hypothetical protein
MGVMGVFGRGGVVMGGMGGMGMGGMGMGGGMF